MTQDWKWHPSLFCSQDLNYRHQPIVANGGWKKYSISMSTKKPPKGLWLLASTGSLVWVTLKEGDEGIRQFRWESNQEDVFQSEEAAFSMMVYWLIFSVEAYNTCKLQTYKLSQINIIVCLCGRNNPAKLWLGTLQDTLKDYGDV